MLFVADTVWYAPLGIHYTVGVDGVSVAMLLLSAIVVFAGVFASWKIDPLPKEFFLWLILLSIGVFGFFISDKPLYDVYVLRDSPYPHVPAHRRVG